jgi:hypothetical protein
MQKSAQKCNVGEGNRKILVEFYDPGNNENMFVKSAKVMSTRCSVLCQSNGQDLLVLRLSVRSGTESA